MRFTRLAILAVCIAVLAVAAAACGDDSADADSAGTEQVEELAGDLVAELEAMCGELITDIGSVEEGPDTATRIDELQEDYIADLLRVAKRLDGAQREAFESYIEAQETAFAASPPVQPGDVQPELEEANATAEAKAAQLGFASCSGV